MTIFVSCACGKTLRVPATSVGKHVRCPECGAVLPVPAAAAPPESDGYAFRDAPPPTEAKTPAERPDPRVRRRARHYARRNRAQKYVYLVLGSLMTLIGLVILGMLVAVIAGGGFSYKILVFGLCFLSAGVTGIVQALTDTMPDSWQHPGGF